ncbi:MAG: hypothetical protein EA363_09080 [Balneolaceae bacterium]|nr:MAG: hypothetical protein EA363_09080 [Balneolaceae bacterium]
MHENPTNEPKDVFFRNLIQDAAWLTEELESLKQMLPDIPYADRPMGQESVLDVLARIGTAHDRFFLPILVSVQRGEANAASGLSIDFETRLKNVTTSEEDPLRLLDTLISQRIDFVALLEKMDASLIQQKITFKDGELDFLTLIARMTRFDRNQLKLIAERMLAMDAKRNVPIDR